MRITLSGALCTGKSTLIDELKKIPEISGKFAFKGEILRDLLKQGVKINEQGTNETQLLVISKMIENAALRNVILDRSVLDSLVYSLYLYEKEQITKKILRIAEAAFENIQYDICFYLPVEFDIIPDGVRSGNKEFRNRIAQLFEEVITAYNYPIIILKGNIQDRVKQFTNVLYMKESWDKQTEQDMVEFYKEFITRPGNSNG